MTPNAAAASSSSSSSATITSLNINDVLLGRGTGPNNFIGNKRFRDHIDTRRQEYLGCNRTRQKAIIAQQVVDHIHGLGGRFVRQVRRGRKENELLVDGVWEEESIDVALERAKQSLREKEHNEGKVKRNKKVVRKVSSSTSDEGGKPSPVVSSPPAPPEEETTSHVLPVASVMSPAVGTLPMPLANPLLNPLNDVPFFLGNIQATGFQQAPPWLQQQQQQQQNPMYPLYAYQFGQTGMLPFSNTYTGVLPLGMLPELCPSANLTATTGVVQQRDGQVYSQVQQQQRDGRGMDWQVQQQQPVPTLEASSVIASSEKHCMDDAKISAAENAQDNVMETPETTQTLSIEPCSITTRTREDEMAAFLLSSFAVKDRQVITDEQFQEERASLTNEQRAAALADTFGKLNINDGLHAKRAKRDLDTESVDFLIQQMRREIDKIPESEKQALIEAKAKCRAEEFSDARLEKFLRCDGMNAELGAQRFVGYWEKRKETFGTEKFTMRLTLSEALRDDLVALQTGFYSLLPRRDASGRQLMYLVPRNHTGEGYSSESMLRAAWYVAEVASHEITDLRGGVVEIGWIKGTNLFEYDPYVADHLVTYLQRYWPVRTISVHVCCAPMVIRRFVLPIIRALAGPWMRSREIIHNVPESEITNALSEYGIEKEMLPTEMGGTVELNVSEWIAQRRALEMEEL